MEPVRPVVEVRAASQDDLRAVVTLAVESREESPTVAHLAAAEPDRLLSHLSVLLAADGHVLVAELEGETVGMLVGRVVGPYYFAGTPSLHLDLVYVASGARRRGVGHALLRVAADIASAHDCTDVYAAPVPGNRGMQRFLARLGFAPALGHRVVAVPTLHRRLAQEAVPVVRESGRGRLRQGARGLEDLIARRRRARSVAESGPIDLRELHTAHRANAG